jgi:hypothetical protein
VGLKAEGFVASQIEGKTLIKQLRDLMEAAKKA